MKSSANQLLAADPNASTWVSANAGTGKTRVLVDRISRLLLDGASPEKLLCLTFTKAAAAEMADRLNDRLAQWARASDKELIEDLRGLTGAAKPPDDLAPARRLFAEVLETPGGLKIRTIHSFCESLLGRFPLEAGMSPHFSVLDDRTAAELLDEARDRLLLGAQRPGGEEMVGALKTLAGMVSEDGFAKLKKELAFRRSDFSKLLRQAGSVNALIDIAYNELGLKQGETEEDVISAAVADAAFDAKGLSHAAKVLAEGKKTDTGRSSIISQWLSMNATEKAAIFANAYMSGFLTQKGEPRGTLITKDLAIANPNVEAHLLAEQDRILQISRRLSAIRVAEQTAALLRFGSALLKEYDSLKSARALLDYDDLILKAAGLLQSNGGVSWVHYKLDGGIDHILIDEAQDTSPAQWEVIERIAEDFYSGLGVQESNMRTVFAVGDEKQSIYSFQGADPEGFRRMRDYFSKKVTDAARRWQTVDLFESYRSTPDVLKTVDQVFATAEAADGVRQETEEIRHHAFRMGQAGLVEIWPTIKPAIEPEVTPWDDPVDQLGADEPAVVLAERIADKIKGWIDDKEILPSQNRPINEGDIMILVRKRGTFTDAMIRALKLRGVPVAGSDRMKLTSQLAVMDLMSLGHFALTPEDDLTLAEVLKGPLIGFDDQALYDVAFGRKGSLWRSLKEKARDGNIFESAVATLSDILNLADFSPPYEFYAHILGAKGGRRAIQARLGHEAADPIDEFLNLALDFTRTHTPSLQRFLHWVATGETEVKRDLETSRQQVRVLTVHGSKGLEANVVFLPDTLSVPSKRQENAILWGEKTPFWPVDKNIEPEACRHLRETMRRQDWREYRRLLYVAMTRAKDRLYVCGFEGKRDRDPGCWYDLVRSAFETSTKAKEVAVPGFDEKGLRIASTQEGPFEKTDEESAADAKPSKPPPWAFKAPPEEPVPPCPLAPSRPSEEEPSVRSPLGTDNGAKFKRGTLIHRLLQSLPEISPEKRAAAAANFLARRVHDLSKDEQQEIAAETLTVLANPDYASLFGPTSSAEAALCGDVSGYVISARIDRLLVTAKTVSIIDYKTNRAPPAKAEQTSPAYLRQMAAYRQALRLVYPDREVRCLLLWTDGPNLMELPNGLLDKHAP